MAKIAALTCKDNHGDVRVAIKTLQYLFMGRFETVEDSFEAAKQDLYLDLVLDQSDSVLLILKAVASCQEKLVKPV